MRTQATFYTAFALILIASGGVASAQADIIVADLPNTWNWGSANNIAAFSVGTMACNIGTANMIWDGATNQHPVIATNMFRLKGGRMEQLGQAWVKHGFASLNSDSARVWAPGSRPSRRLEFDRCVPCGLGALWPATVGKLAPVEFCGGSVLGSVL